MREQVLCRNQSLSPGREKPSHIVPNYMILKRIYRKPRMGGKLKNVKPLTVKLNFIHIQESYFCLLSILICKRE